METLETIATASKVAQKAAGAGSEAILLTFAVLCILVMAWFGRYLIKLAERERKEAKETIRQLVAEKNESSKEFQKKLIEIIGQQNATSQHLAACLERNSDLVERVEEALREKAEKLKS